MESEDVQSLQTEILRGQDGGQDGLHTLRAEVRLLRLQEIYPGSVLMI